MAEKNIYNVLKEDHDKFKQLLNQVLINRIVSEFPELKKELEAHMIGEEKSFYPVIRSKSADLALKCYEEHELVRKLLYELDNLNIADEHWIPKSRVLKDLLDHHTREEERDMFDKAKEILDEDAQKQLTKEFEEEKSKIMHMNP